MLFFQWLGRLIVGPPDQRDVEEAYLAKAVDIWDLERRMRELEQRRDANSAGALTALGSR